MSAPLGFDDVRRSLREEAKEAKLRIEGERVLLDLDSLDRTLTLDVVPSEWDEGALPRAGISLVYRPSHQMPVESDDEVVEIDVEYVLVASESGVPLSELEARVRPHVENLHGVLGGDPLEVYYTVATDYKGTSRAVEAKVVDVVEAQLDPEKVFSACLEVVASGLRAIGPLP